MEIGEADLALQGPVAQFEIGAAFAAVDLLETEAGDQSHTEAIGHAIYKVRERAEIILARDIVSPAMAVDPREGNGIEEIGLEQEMPRRQRARRRGQKRAGPPGIIQRLMVCASRRFRRRGRGKAYPA